MLGRLFCFSGGRESEWTSHAHYGAQMAGARARVLEVVAAELDERYAALAPTSGRASATVSQDLLSHRLYGANLPSAELTQCRDLLRKLAGIDGARAAAQAEQQQLAAQLKSAEAAHRQAEFARARAEAIATARGEALMHAQRETREADQENLRLAELLRQVLPLVGIEADIITPLKGPSPGNGLPMLTAGVVEDVTPAPRQSIFSKQQLEAVAASISKLPRQSLAHSHQQQRWASAEAEAAHAREQQLRCQEEEEEAQRHAAQEQRAMHEQAELRRQQQRRRGSRPGSQQPSRERGERQRGRDSAALPPARASVDGGVPQQEEDQLSGFTVYTNELEGAELGADDGEVARPERPPAVQPTADGGVRDSQGSGVQWRSISSAALTSRSASEAVPDEDVAAADLDQEEAELLARLREQQQRIGRSRGGSLRASQASQGSGRGQQAARASAGSQHDEAAPANKLNQHARQLSRLVLPGLDASQLDSLVRIGASMQSPDRHLMGSRHQSPVEVLQQLLPPGWEQAVGQWDSSVNPLQSNANAEAFLSELHAEMQRQGGSQPGGGGRGRQPSHGEGQRREAGGRAGSEPPAGYDYYRDSKFPGAGTWVSPSLAAMLAHKKGYNPLLEGGEPSPPSHIKAVFGTSEDKEFYGPMAAHLNRREQPREAQRAPAAPAPPARPPTSASAESIQGPQRPAPSARASLEGRRSAELDHQAAARQAAAPAAAAPRAPSALHHASVDQPPQRRQAALHSGFQPMGMHVQASTALPVQQQQQAVAPRRSSVAVSSLRASGSLRSSDENLAAAVAGSKAGLPPRGAPLPPTKRSLDSMRASAGGAAAAESIQASLHAVDAAMAALRNANPHLSRDAPTQQQRGAALPLGQHQQQYQQQQQLYAGRASDAGVGAAAAGRAARPVVPRPHHTRTRSLPDVTAADLPLAAMGEEQRRREQAQQQHVATAGGQRRY